MADVLEMPVKDQVNPDLTPDEFMQGTKPKQKHDWSSTQFNLPEELATPILAFAESIPAEKKLPKEERQDQPHLTLLYGIDSEDVSPVEKALKGAEPVRVKIGKLSLFENDDADVLKLDVESPEIHALNAEIRKEVPHVAKQPEYEPHITVAYMLPGEGAEYAGKALPGVTGKRVRLADIQFSSKNGDTAEIKL